MDEIFQKLDAFKRKYYQRQLIIGLLIFLILSVGFFGIFSLIEYQFWLNKLGRALLLFLYLGLVGFTFYKYVIDPYLLLKSIKRGLSNEEVAREIERHFPEIEDRLLNAIQLGKIEHSDNQLLSAAINKKVIEFKSYAFQKAIDFKEAKRYATVFAIIIIGLAMVSFINPDVLSDSPSRIIQYNKEFVKEAPFSFELLNEELNAFKGEDFTLHVKLNGKTLPDEVFLIDSKTRIRLNQKEANLFQYNFTSLQNSKEIQFEAAGYVSPTYELIVNERPDLVELNIEIRNPEYTGGELVQISNTGNLQVLEGANVNWQFLVQATEAITFLLNEDTLAVNKSSKTEYLVNAQVLEEGSYAVELINEYGRNKSEISYSIEVLKDAYPKITVNPILDSTNYSYVAIAGTIQDDYGFKSLNLFFESGKEDYQSLPVSIAKDTKQQSFFTTISTDSLSIIDGTKIQFYLIVTDNDAINSFKSTKSRTFDIKVPSKKELENIITSKSESVENQLNKSTKEVSELNKKLEELEDRLKAEQKIGWQEEKMIDELLKEKKKVSEVIDQLKKDHDQLNKSKSQFQNQSESVQQKNKQLQELLNELMDKETLELYEKLKELLEEENTSSDNLRNKLEEIKKNEANLQKELERALELFKRLKLESEIEKNLQELDSLSSKQEQLAQQEQLDKEEQEKISQEFDDFRKQMDKIQEMNQELDKPAPIEDFDLEERVISKELREIEEEMEEMKNEGKNENGEEKNSNGENTEPQQNSEQKKSIQQKQKNASQKMKALSQKLSKMQSGMQMEMMQANLDQLRDITDNLIKLSFEQESLIKEMREVDQSNPRFLELSQNQLKLKDDAKVIQDSLTSLASRVVQLSSFITREVGVINENINQSIDYLKDRNRGRAITSQQFTMTAINNLALLLDDTMQQMQMAMAESMGNSKSNKPNQNGLPDLQKLQEQLGEDLSKLQGSQKSGRELSEELARLAAMQELIRRQMEMLKEAEDGKPGGGAGGEDLERAIQMMEQNEIDLVNKRIKQQLIARQQAIMTRMLEAEKAQREQSEKEEREAERANKVIREVPPEFEEYLKLKQKEIELLKSIPLDLNPFYKKEVSDYFRRISSDEQND
jgi:hypothetical protein